ncbi:MAG: RNA-binding cell elongation regulator Jag/EloR [Thermoflexales bacterium]
MPSIEITAADVESAIEEGLRQLNLLRAEVKIEVLEEGSRGVLGLGARQARVRLTPYTELTEATAAPASAGAVTPAPSEEATPAESPTQALATAEPPVESTSAGPTVEPKPHIDGETLAGELTAQIVRLMGFPNAQVTTRSIFPEHPEDEPYLWVDIVIDPRGEALWLARKAEALNALQHIVQTLWSHRTKSSLRVNVDVNGYHARRERQLRAMARRLAERVVNTGEPFTLEPMPANERRIIHLELRDNPQVYTESTGEGEARKVQIKLRPAAS